MFTTIQIKLWIPQTLIRLSVPMILFYRKMRYGYPFRLIKLTRGCYAKVDPEDFESLNKYNWYLSKCAGGSYAVRMTYNCSRKLKISMHRQLMNAPKELVVDHINHDGLDNRKANLRLATMRQNSWNTRRERYRGSSKHKGVSWNKYDKKWRASIVVDGKQKLIGKFDDEIQAALAYDREALIHRKDFALLNFPQLHLKKPQSKIFRFLNRLFLRKSVV